MNANLESKIRYIPIMVLLGIFLWFWYIVIKLNFFRSAVAYDDLMIIFPLFLLVIVGTLSIIEYKKENSNPVTHSEKSELLLNISIILLLIPILTCIIIYIINNYM